LLAVIGPWRWHFIIYLFFMENSMLIAVLSGFVLALFAPSIHQWNQKYSGVVLSLLPIGLFAYFAYYIHNIANGEVIRQSVPWIPSLGIYLSFYLDGLSLVFALLVSGIGFLVVSYGSGYLAEDKDLGRFYLYVMAFMGSMLGVVLCDNMITMFVFWELTGISSYMLIGLKHEDAGARYSAQQALLVTLAGGLALMAGLVMVGIIGDSFEFSELLARGDMIRHHTLYPAILAMVILGAFTKSAQFPFHFWLPNAMAAPTPVSAYLHSATMVKSGIYLLARLTPLLGGTDLWYYSVTLGGAFTMVLGAHMAWQRSDIKQILAYTTISGLGMLVMLIGIETDAAVKAAMVFLIVHAFYKGCLFMAAGAIDHETGTREIGRLGGLWRVMPITAAATLLAALSMAGLPPFFGFVGKELIYETTLGAPALVVLLTSATVFAKALTMVAAGKVAIIPFFGPLKETPKRAHEAPESMWRGPVVLSLAGLALGLAPGFLAQPLVSAAVDGILREDILVHLHLIPKEMSAKVLLSLSTIAIGIVSFLFWRRLSRLIIPLTEFFSRHGPERWYQWFLKVLVNVAEAQTRFLQNGYLRNYLLTILLTVMILLAATMWRFVPAIPFGSLGGIGPHEWMVTGLVALGALLTIKTHSRLTAVTALGVVGYGIAMIYVLFNAPDLAMTQLAVETLTVILLVLVLHRLPRFAAPLTSAAVRRRDAVICAVSGAIMTLVILVVAGLKTDSLLTPFFAEKSWLLAKGRNVDNVILVDFRAMDTMGEISVLAIAAIGVVALVRLRPKSSASGDSCPMYGGERITIDQDVISDGEPEIAGRKHRSIRP
jgi:multicomponent Na+:H+ antiporter subunit A